MRYIYKNIENVNKNADYALSLACLNLFCIKLIANPYPIDQVSILKAIDSSEALERVHCERLHRIANKIAATDVLQMANIPRFVQSYKDTKVRALCHATARSLLMDIDWEQLIVDLQDPAKNAEEIGKNLYKEFDILYNDNIAKNKNKSQAF